MGIQKINFSEIKAVIFDMDGTMVDNDKFHMKAFQKFCKKYDKKLTDEDYIKNYSGRSNNQLMPKVFGKDLSEDDIKRLAEEKEAIYRKLYAPHIKPIPGLHEFIVKLKKKKIMISIATGSIVENRDFVLEAIGLKGKFPVIVGGEDFKNGKPHPEIFLTTAKKLKTDPNDCLVFEDAPAGIEAAKNAGMKVVGIITSHKPEELKKADFVIGNFQEVLNLLS
jgi:beta-phosphoglucomutase family hydrolase